MSAIQKAPSGNRRRRANPVSDCPLTAALAALGGKWKLIILYWLARSPRHFAALRRDLDGVSQKVLTQQLRELVGDEIVLRTSRGAVPARVEYSLTKYGRSLLPLVEALRTWGRGHIERFRDPEEEPGGVSTGGPGAACAPAGISASPGPLPAPLKTKTRLAGLRRSVRKP